MKRIYLVLLSLMMLIGIVNRTNAQTASLKTSYPSYVKGDSIVFSFVSPNFSAKDKIAIYPDGTIPGAGNQPIAWKYIPASTGAITFKTALNVGSYAAYLLCCDGYNIISSSLFEVVAPSVAFLTAKSLTFEPGVTMEFAYNDPAFAAADRIAIFKDGEPATGTPITYSLLVKTSGIVSFPGVLATGYYYAVLLSATNTEYVRSEVFGVPDKGNGSYVKTAANVYPVKSTILVNYKDVNYSNKDRIGIYKTGQIPGGPAPLFINYAPKDSSTIEVNALPLGDYTLYLLCCDGFNIKAQSDFKVVGLTTASLVLSALSFEVGDAMEFIYNDPNFVSGAGTDWIGIYHQGDIPSDVRSIVWDYLKNANGKMTFSVPYPLGTLMESDPKLPLGPGAYYAGLFCCDGYGLYASISFTVKAIGTGVKDDLKSESRLSLFPNPTSGLVNIKIAEGEKIQKIVVYSTSSQVLYEEILSGTVNQKVLDLKLNKGIYLLEVTTDKYKTSKKLIIK